MYFCLMQNQELLKGTLKTIILHMLDRHGRMYGYELTQRVRELSDDYIQITEGALYPTLHKLEAEGALVTEKEYIGKRVRKYYKITPGGKSLFKQRMGEFQEFMHAMQLVLQLKPKQA